MDIQTAIMNRRTIRRFAPKPITDRQLTALVDLARLYASGGNLQPIRFIGVTKEELTELEKALKALEIIKNSGYISIDIMLSQNYITRKEYDLLKEVFYELPTKQV